jgi:hypothetical protein
VAAAGGPCQTRRPSRRAPTGRGTDPVCGEAASGEYPCDHRVGVPHLARPELVAAPDRSGQAANHVQEATGHERIVAQQSGACDRLVGVRDGPVPPAAYLVSEQPPARYPAAPDGAFDDHATRCRSVAIGDRPAVLDDKASLRDADHERGVVQVERPPALQEGMDGLVDAPVAAHEPATGPQWKPVQLDAGPGGRRRHRRLGGTGWLGLGQSRHDRLWRRTRSGRLRS